MAKAALPRRPTQRVAKRGRQKKPKPGEGKPFGRTVFAERGESPEYLLRRLKADVPPHGSAGPVSSAVIG